MDRVFSIMIIQKALYLFMRTHFAPQLFVPSPTFDISFYTIGLGAVELRRFSNDDKSIHVSELSIDGCVFHLHEAKPSAGQLDPKQVGSNSVLIGLFVDDVDALMKRAVAAGATVTHEAQDYDYGYRQGEFRDPFGHLWLIEKKI